MERIPPSPVHIGCTGVQLFRGFCAALGTQHVTGTPYHSQSQGGAERQHRTLLQQLRVTCDDNTNWDDYLEAVAHTYNDSVHAVTKVAPFVALYGCHSRLPWHLQLVTLPEPNVSQLVSTHDVRVNSFLEKQRAVYKQILKHLCAHAEKMQAQLANLPTRTFKVGDQVKVQYGLKGATDKHKLDAYYVGPFTIAEDLGNGAYKLHIPPKSSYSDIFNAHKLALWIDSYLTLFLASDDIGNSLARLPPDCKVESAIAIRRYLLRDYRYFPHKPVRYWVQKDSAETPYVWVDESSDLLDEFLSLEENNACIPERGISDENKEAVKIHKQQIYLQYPSPILVNTWTSARLPVQTRTRPAFKPPQTLLNAVVQQLFHISETNQAYYQGWLSR
eukprot:scaffold753_cov390-Pavlova_lutheri.AAC.19